ncbi:uncharacterized protein N7477_010125 [Penicillium maclennaniae]|uniref:uncharacterized protein n=1 Tax=Penicillium maclennaniae TaxID=1343394 RepID=UPI0025407A0F|nr:uncharacterized protein N7477_010125 [Penicillium maclennaniae]KAJ5662509.1 hypothetical protein N7477_010125 [Penicillium maclennaniae]
MSLHISSNSMPGSLEWEAKTSPLSALVPGRSVNSSTQVESLEGEKSFAAKGTEAAQPHVELSSKATPKTVLVVGAGIAGLRAASILKRHGLHVIVLEARDRIGGRILTSRKNGKPARDMGTTGAAWMHETSQNKLVKLVPKLGLSYYYDDGTPVYYTSDGRAGSQFKAKKVVDEFADYAEWFYETSPDAKDRSVDEFIRDFTQNHPLITQDERQWAPQVIKEAEQWVGTSTSQASSKHLTYFVTERNLYMKDGYDSIVNWTAKDMFETPDCIRLHHIVKRDMQEGIKSLSYGALGKIFFEFSEVFWSKNHDQFIYYPSPHDTTDEMVDTANVSEISDTILNYATVTVNLLLVADSKELCVQVVEPLTQKVEAITDKKELYEFFEPLFKLLRKEPYKALPQVTSIESTCWTRDAFAGFGAYTSEKVGDDPNILINAAQSRHKSKLQFAGEHLALAGSGCVHGAFATGEAAAKRILHTLSIEVRDELFDLE